MLSWVAEEISFTDYIKNYVDNPNVKFIPNTAHKGMIKVLVNRDIIKGSLVCHTVPLQKLF